MAAPDRPPAQMPRPRPTMLEAVADLPIELRVTLVATTLVVGTVLVEILEHSFGVADASPLYLIPVVLAAAFLGTWAAVATSLTAFVIYDYLFTTPRFTFTVSDPAEWLNLLLFLLVAVVLGRVAALLRDRAEEANRRAREAEALVAISRDIAVATTFDEAAVAVAGRLRRDAEMETVWITLADRPGQAIAATGPEGLIEGDAPWTLVRSATDGGSDWLRLRGEAGATGAPGEQDTADEATPAATTPERYAVAIGTGEEPVGWIQATRIAGDPMPGRGARRLLTLAADQLGIALRRDQLRDEATAAEVARQSDALRAAILDSVSHDLRTPIASIRALAGGLADPATSPTPSEVRVTAAAIDEEGAGLARLVNGLLDMGRIQAGAVRADLRPYDLRDLVETALRRVIPEVGRGNVDVAIPGGVPPVLADAVLFDAAFGNVLENARLHSGAAGIRVAAAATGDDRVVLAVDDAGPGVPDEALGHLFERFYRVTDSTTEARRGMGMGLAIAKGFTEAMGGAIDGRRSELGGLRIELTLRASPELAAE